MTNAYPISLLEKKAILQILLRLLEVSSNQSDLIKHGSDGIASQGAVISSLENLKKLGLVNEEVVLRGITKSKALYYSLTDKGRDVARLVLKIQERLEAE